jgi:hypothetical protein
MVLHPPTLSVRGGTGLPVRVSNRGAAPLCPPAGEEDPGRSVFSALNTATHAPTNTPSAYAEVSVRGDLDGDLHALAVVDDRELGVIGHVRAGFPRREDGLFEGLGRLPLPRKGSRRRPPPLRRAWAPSPGLQLFPRGRAP